MKNLDVLNQKKADILNKLNQAVKDGNEEAFQQAFTEFTEILQEAVLAEAKGLIEATDNQILSGRGVRALTSEETKYYQSVIEAMKSSNPKQSLSDLTVVMPKTVIDAVFEDLVEAHPLLALINFQNTSGLIEYLINTGSAPLATWQALTATIVTELTRGFSKIDLAHKKLSAFIPVAKAMLDLGPTWIDRFVRAILGEAIFNGLEDGIIDGDGLLEPVGMNKNLAAPVDPVTGYPAKVKIPVSDFSPANYGALIARIAIGPNGNVRIVPKVVLIVNPVDYLTKVMPATTQLINGTYVNNIFPFPTEVIQSTKVTQGSAILGIASKYFMGIGTAQSGKIEYSDEYHFLEDERVYLIKLYGTGRPVDNNAFLYLDISGLKPIFQIVRSIPYADATLKSLTVAAGAVAISPAFDGAIRYYTADTANATDAVAATKTDANATVTGTLNGQAADLTKALAWVEGQNVVIITVTNGDRVETYALVVTYTPAEPEV